MITRTINKTATKQYQNSGTSKIHNPITSASTGSIAIFMVLCLSRGTELSGKIERSLYGIEHKSSAVSDTRNPVIAHIHFQIK